MKHSDYITHIDNKEDLVYLRSIHFPVNMRLFKTSKQYKEIILLQCDYIKSLCLNTKDGYKKPHGMSSANAGLSFNIIGITKNRNKSNEYCQIMINPSIIEASEDTTFSESNCGSLTLINTIAVERNNNIIVEYYTEDGKIHTDLFKREDGGFSIQHEIDHNRGVLIKDY